VDDRLLFDADAGVNLPARERGCGCVFQSESLFPHMSLFENLWFAAGRFPRRERRSKVREMLERFHVEELGSRRPHELSGGQRQRGAIARAILSQPSLLLLDEPTRGLDVALREEFYSVLREARSAFGIPVVMVTHDIDEALELGVSMHVLVSGRIAQSGSPREILDTPATAAVARLMGCYNILPAEILALDPASNRSRLRISAGEETRFEILGPYLPGLMLGAKVLLAVREDEIEFGTALDGGVTLQVRRVVPLVRGARLELDGGIRVTVPAAPDRDQLRSPSVRFRPQSLSIVKA
jgi:ABC-type sulfate/molybdate transport systems ATPase subunit